MTYFKTHMERESLLQKDAKRILALTDQNSEMVLIGFFYKGFLDV